jgi:hypothetical protein
VTPPGAEKEGAMAGTDVRPSLAVSTVLDELADALECCEASPKVAIRVVGGREARDRRELQVSGEDAARIARAIRRAVAQERGD